MSLPANHLARALDVVADVFVAFDRDFNLVYHNESNRSAMRLAGMDPDAAVGKPVLEALPQLAGTVGHRETERALRERVVTQWEESYGDELRLRGRAYPTDDGGVLVVATNVTAEWTALEDARAARDLAQQANRAKTDFLAAMSHELRTPLNAIGGYTDLLLMGLRGQLQPQQQDDLTRIARNQAHLLAIISDLLNFARLESGDIKLEVGPVSTHDVLGNLEALLLPQIQQKNLALRIQPAPGLMVRADRERTEQVLLNLLANATKFTDHGGSIGVSVRPQNGEVHIAVQDTGVGIPADKLDVIFEPFVQVHHLQNQRSPGTGLGLAISRDLARRMGGDITVQSVVGEGSTFTLALPRLGA